MPSHLKTGELYAFATNEGNSIVGKIIRTNVGDEEDRIDIHIYDRRFKALTPRQEIVESLSNGKTPAGFATTLSRRQFAFMYPLYLGNLDVRAEEQESQSRDELIVEGSRARFERSQPYFEPILLFFISLAVEFVFFAALCFRSGTSAQELFTAAGELACIFGIPLALLIALVSVVFRFIESRRTGLSLKHNPHAEFVMNCPFEEAFRRCRDTLGEKSSRDFDYVDRHSGYIQSRIANRLIIRILLYANTEETTGVIVSCSDLDGGALGGDLWMVRNLVERLSREHSAGIETGSQLEQSLSTKNAHVIEKGPIFIAILLRRVFWFVITAIFASVSAIFLKGTMSGAQECLPLLTMTTFLTVMAGFFLFRTSVEAKDSG